MGELIAEIGSCFAHGRTRTADDGQPHEPRRLSPKLAPGMNGDPKFIFRAAAQASKAVEFLMSFSRDRCRSCRASGTTRFRFEDGQWPRRQR